MAGRMSSFREAAVDSFDRQPNTTALAFCWLKDGRRIAAMRRALRQRQRHALRPCATARLPDFVRVNCGAATNALKSLSFTKLARLRA